MARFIQTCEINDAINHSDCRKSKRQFVTIKMCRLRTHVSSMNRLYKHYSCLLAAFVVIFMNYKQ